MKEQVQNIIIILLIVNYCHGGEIHKVIGEDTDQCPPWFVYNPTTKECECYNSPSTNNIVKCTKEGALLRLGHCMTYQSGEGVFVSPCYYRRNDDHNITKGMYIRLPESLTELNEFMCVPLNSEGVACSECINEFGRPVMSREFTCSNCTNAWYGLPLYLFMEFVPITAFYFIVLLFNVNMTSAPMLAYVFFCQVSVSVLVRLQNFAFDASHISNFLTVLITFYGFWSLDFCRYVLPPFCVSPNLHSIHIISLHYISAFYPLCLIGITWFLIKLHTQDIRPITWLWSKLNQCLLKCTGTKVEVKNTLIDVFATFFLLSYAKLAFTGFTLLSFGTTFNLNNGTLASAFHLEFDPSIGFFSNGHLPFVVVAITIFTIAIIPLTLLLVLYPVQRIRSLLFLCRPSNRAMASVNIFVEKFYNSYRDGLDGGKDMRSLASLYFFLRLIINIVFIHQIPLSASFTFVTILYAGCSLLIAIVRPYKEVFMNTIDSLILANMALISVLLDNFIAAQDNGNALGAVYFVAGGILATLPMLGMIGVISSKIIKKLMKRMPVKNKLCCLQKKRKDDKEAHQQTTPESADDCELPHRILHTEEYEEERATASMQEQT